MARKASIKKKKKPELNADEKAFLATISSQYPYLEGMINFGDEPYEGTNYRSDLVLPLPYHPWWVGAVVEIQGGTRQGWGTHKGKRTGHSTPDAIQRDNHKCIVAQRNRYLYIPVVTETVVYLATGELLHEVYMEFRDL